MLQKIAHFFYRIAGLKTFVAALIIYVLFAVLVMGGAAQKMNELAGKEVEILDLQFTGYSPEKARGIIGEYGDAGRQYSVFVSAVDDSIYPFIYTFLMIVIGAWIFKSLAAYRQVNPYLHLAPLLIFVFDFCENACLITMLKTYPYFSDSVVFMASAFTRLKWLAFFGITVALLVWLGILIAYRLRKPQSA